MRSKWVLVIAVVGLFSMCASARAAIKTETVTYKSGNETVSGYLALPGTPGKHPALIVIHEWWGLVPWVKEQTDKFAAEGYVALAVDLYRGQTTENPKEAAHLMSTMPPQRALRDLKAAFTYLSSRPDVEPGKIGDVGWCFGGGWALRLATVEPKLAACAINYGELTTDASALGAIRCPVLGNFGALDPNITPAKVGAFEAAMRKAGKSINVKIYPGATHAFENPNNKTGYRPRDAANAWARMTAFFSRTLK
ncbi:MAG TPA: dienelactone hydrolase family protein [Patescibacteria group bacterium]|nr:dienelactone hydrolase family protein [Patescibacteria group bacterium]